MRWLAAIVAFTGCSTEKKNHEYFAARVGSAVTLVGRVSANPWQHMVRGVPDKQLVYIDLDGGDYQIVAHFAREPSCAGEVAFDGVVFEVRGPSKGAQRGEPGAAGEEYWEYAVDVASWRCR